MKKCVCISCFNCYEIRMKAIINYFCEKGYDTTYLISDYDHYTKKRYTVSYDNSLQLHVPSYKNNISPARLFSHYVFSKKICKQLLEIQPDIVYCIFPPNYLVKETVKYKCKTNSKLILDMFDSWPESLPKLQGEGLLNPLLKMWRNPRDKYIEKADLILLVSSALQNLAIPKWSNSRISLLLPAIDNVVKSKKDFAIEDQIVFCYLGNINYITDIELAEKFFYKLNKVKKTTVHIIGEGQDLNKFIDCLEKSGTQVICHGIVYDEKEKEKIFSQCDMALNIPREEIITGMSLKSIDYMRFGLPYINSGIGENFKLVEEESIGINVDRSNVDKSVNQVTQLTSDKLSQMHEKCIEVYIKRFLKQDLDGILKIIL